MSNDMKDDASKKLLLLLLLLLLVVVVVIIKKHHNDHILQKNNNKKERECRNTKRVFIFSSGCFDAAPVKVSVRLNVESGVTALPVLRRVQLLSVLHPHHLDVWLRHLTLKNGFLLLRDLDVSDFLGEFNHTSWKQNQNKNFNVSAKNYKEE